MSDFRSWFEQLRLGDVVYDDPASAPLGEVVAVLGKIDGVFGEHVAFAVRFEDGWFIAPPGQVGRITPRLYRRFTFIVVE